jgi:hypothetical protein
MSAGVTNWAANAVLTLKRMPKRKYRPSEVEEAFYA